LSVTGVREAALRRIELCQHLPRMTNEKLKVWTDSCLFVKCCPS